MARVEQPVQLAPAPARDNVDPNVERGSDLSQCVEPGRSDVPALDKRNQRSRYAGPLGHVLLAPATPHADGSKSGTDAHVVHAAKDGWYGCTDTYVQARSQAAKMGT